MAERDNSHPPMNGNGNGKSNGRGRSAAAMGRMRGNLQNMKLVEKAKAITKMNRGERRLRITTSMWCLVLTLGVVIFESLGQLAPMERWLGDRRTRYCQFFMPEPTDKLVHLDITDPDLQNIGRWPWPRTTMAGILDEITHAGAKAVAFDILYTEPADPRYVPIPGHPGQYDRVDDDEAFAASLARSGNSLLGVNLQSDVRPRTEIYTKVVDLYVSDLEMTDAEIATALAAGGNKAKDLDEQVKAIALSARRDAAQIRIDRELDVIHRSVLTLPATNPALPPATLPASIEASAATQPTTQASASLPTSEPSTRPAVIDGETAVDPVLRQLWKRILVKSGQYSPQGRLVAEEYQQVLAKRELRRLATPIPLHLPELTRITTALIPLPVLTRQAAAVGFVDYPVYKDGVVRSVQLVVQYDGRMYPQIALMLAAMTLDANPKDFRYAEDSITIPGKGPGGKDIVIPVRTHHPEGGGNPIPMTMDIPWFGTTDWEHMYPRQPHRPITVANNPIDSMRRVANSTRAFDGAVEFLLNIRDVDLGGNRLAEFHARHLSPEDIPARLEIAKSLIEQYDPIIPAGTKVEEAGDDVVIQRTIAAVEALRAAQKELPSLKHQLDGQRAELRRLLNGKAVVIGWAATAAVADRKPTSIHPDAPGVVVHGTIFNAIMTGELWRTLPHRATILTTLLLGLIVTVIVTLLPPGRAASYAGLLAVVYLLFNGIVLFDYGNLILGLAGPIAAIALVWAVGTMTRLIIEGIERARITKRFAAYVDPELVEFVLEHDNVEVFKGVKREITTVFTDLQGFTSLSEKLGTEIVPILNDFMDRATRVIKRHHGYVNKFLGDGVMFFYNAPRPRETHAADAVRTVVELYVMLEQFNKDLAAKDLPQLALRAGVSTGELIVGDAGSRERCDYTVIGDPANLAARLESANKATGTRNMMTERTIELAGDKFLFRPIGRLQVVGQTNAGLIYEAMAPIDLATPEQKRLVDLTAAMVNASLEGRPADCLEAAAVLEEAFGESKLTHLYRDKCEAYLRDPTPGEFDRHIVLTSK